MTAHGCALWTSDAPCTLLLFLCDWKISGLCVEIICWAPWNSQVQNIGLPRIFLRAQPRLTILAFPSAQQEYFSMILLRFLYERLFYIGLDFRSHSPNNNKVIMLSCVTAFGKSEMLNLLREEVGYQDTCIVNFCFLMWQLLL